MRINENPLVLAELRDRHGLNNRQVAELLVEKQSVIESQCCATTEYVKRRDDNANKLEAIIASIFMKYKCYYPYIETRPSLQVAAAEMLADEDRRLPPEIRRFCNIINRGN